MVGASWGIFRFTAFIRVADESVTRHPVPHLPFMKGFHIRFPHAPRGADGAARSSPERFNGSEVEVDDFRLGPLTVE